MTLVIPDDNPAKVEYPDTPNVPPTVALLEIVEEYKVDAPACNPAKVVFPVTPNVPPTVALLEMAADARVDAPVTPNVPPTVAFPLADKLEIEVAPVTPNVPPTVAFPLADKLEIEVEPEVMDPTVSAPEEVMDDAVSAPEDSVPATEVFPVVPLIVNLSVLTANEPPGLTERVVAEREVAFADPNVEVPFAVREVLKVPVGAEREVAKVPVGADNPPLNVPVVAERPCKIEFPLTVKLLLNNALFAVISFIVV